MTATSITAHDRATTSGALAEPVQQAFWLLRIGFTVAPIAFGLDKFAEVLRATGSATSPFFNDIIPAAHTTPCSSSA